MGTARQTHFDDPNLRSGEHAIVGDLVAAGDANPVLTPAPLPDPDPAVELNVSMARQPDGAHCIRIVGPRVLTCAQAYQLAVDLTEASEQGAELRRKGGFEQ